MSRPIPPRLAFAAFAELARGNPLWAKFSEEVIKENHSKLYGMSPRTTIDEARVIQEKCRRKPVDYDKKRREGVCFDCSRKAAPGILRCTYHSHQAVKNNRQTRLIKKWESQNNNQGVEQ